MLVPTHNSLIPNTNISKNKYNEKYTSRSVNLARKSNT